MVLHFGKKRVEKRLGFVAGFCPICRDVRAFRLIQVSVATAFNEVPLGKGILAGHLVECVDCQVRLQSSLEQYPTAEPEYPLGLDWLVERTCPDLRAQYSGRLKVEAGLKKGRSMLLPEQRGDYLLEPFLILSPMVDARFRDPTRMDVPSTLGGVATFLLTVVSFYCAIQFFHGPAQDRALIGVAIVLGLGVFFGLLQLHLAPSRFVRRRIGLMAARALRPLDPSQGEIEDCLQKCREKKLRIGRELKTDQLWLQMKLTGGSSSAEKF